MFQQFLRVSMHKLDGLERTTDQICDLFREFDENGDGTALRMLVLGLQHLTDLRCCGSGTVPAYIVRHLMSEVHSQTELSDASVQLLLQFTGVSSTGTFGRKNNPLEPVDYRHLVDVMRW